MAGKSAHCVHLKLLVVKFSDFEANLDHVNDRLDEIEEKKCR